MHLGCSFLQLSTVSHHNLLRGGTSARPGLFDFIKQFLAINKLAKDGMVSIQVRRGIKGDEELGTVGVGTGVGHRQVSSFGVRHIKVFVVEGAPVDALRPGHPQT